MRKRTSKWNNRLLAGFLALLMVVSLMPMPTYAAEAEPTAITEVADAENQETAGTKETVSDPQTEGEAVTPKEDGAVASEADTDSLAVAADTDPADAVVDPTPVITITADGQSTFPTDDGFTYREAKGYLYKIGATPTTLSASITNKVEGATYEYQWSKVTSKTSTSNTSYSKGETCVPKTDTAVDEYYICKVTCTFEEKTYTVYSNKQENAQYAYVFVQASQAEVPTISTQPQGNSYYVGDTIQKISVSATRNDGGKLTYQWYKNTTDSNSGGTPISGATQNSYTPEAMEDKGTIYYYCEVTNTLQIFQASAVSNTAKVEFKSVEEAVGSTLEGKGTVEAPYLLKMADDFVNLAKFVNDDKIAFNGCYFHVTADITLPDDWQGIGTVDGAADSGKGIRPFSGILDGGGHTLTFAKGSNPLFNYVRQAKVSNFAINAPYIPTNGLVANYVLDKGADGGKYVPTIDIDHVTIKSGSTIKGSGFIGGYASGENVINITNCIVESGVKIGYDADKNGSAGFSKVGSFGGEFNGNIKNSTSGAAVYGDSYVGGIVGGKGQSMGNYSISNCSFTGEVIADGSFVGGIAGGGYNGGTFGADTARNTPCASIVNCYSNGKISGTDKVGGIYGGEEVCNQNWAEAYIRNNCFVGSVTASGGQAGGIIGYMASLNKMNVIENNYLKLPTPFGVMYLERSILYPIKKA